VANVIGYPSNYDLSHHGLTNLNLEYWTLPSPMLVERIVQRQEGQLAHLGPVVVRTGHHTGRSPNDKLIVRTPGTEAEIWWGKVNRPMAPEAFERLHMRMRAYFQGRDVYVQDAYAGAHPQYRLPIRVITEYAWHSLFARNLFLRLEPEALAAHVPEFTILDAPRFHAIPEEDGTNSEVFIVLNLEKKLILIGGSSYAGEIKKAVFTVMNYMLPKRGVLSMHCSANVSGDGEVALFFGLSGTGKTTLSSDPERRLIGDDEHGWGDDGVFNIEGGCYAKTINLRADLEPLIWKATRRFGTVLENVAVNVGTRRMDFDDSGMTENTRAAYPIGFIDNHVPEGRAGHPTQVFGVHGVGGTFGAIATGLFATSAVNGAVVSEGLLYGGGFDLLGKQLIAVAAVWAFAFGVTYLVLAIMKKVMAVRMSRDEERVGADIIQHGENAYDM